MYSTSIVVDDVIDALAAFVQPFVGTAEIVRAQTNRVPMPATPCVVLTELVDSELGLSRVTYDPDNNQANIAAPTSIDVQIDFYAPDAGDWAKSVQAALRSSWGYDQFPANIRPAYCGNAIQAPMITGEEQWQSRWTLTATLQYNPVIAVPQAFADVLTPTAVVPVEILS